MCTYRRFVKPSGGRKRKCSGRHSISLWQGSKGGFIRLETDHHRETGGISLRRDGGSSNTHRVTRSFSVSIWQLGRNVEVRCRNCVSNDTLRKLPGRGTVSSRDEEEPSGRKVSGLFLFALCPIPQSDLFGPRQHWAAVLFAAPCGPPLILLLMPLMAAPSVASAMLPVGGERTIDRAPG